MSARTVLKGVITAAALLLFANFIGSQAAIAIWTAHQSTLEYQEK